MAERALEQRAEDLRLHLPPGEGGDPAQPVQLVDIEVDLCRLLEQCAVDIRHARVHAVARPLSSRREPAEELAEVVGAGPPAIAEQAVEDLREAMLRDLAEVLREHAPDRLQEEVAQHVGRGGAALPQHAIEIGELPHRVARHRHLPAEEHRLATGEEQ